MRFPLWAWIAFGATVLVLIAIDLFAHRGERADSVKRAAVWSAVWIGAGLAFNVLVWIAFGSKAASQYLAAYLIEKSLSLDNLFVFLVIFRSLGIPQDKQRTVLFWGILGAIVFRAIFIFLGAAALERWDWVSWFFGAILLFAAWRVFREDPSKKEENEAVKWLSRHLPVTNRLEGNRFVAVRNGRRVATPLLIALLGLEMTDILFAVDSVPAAFSITHERFLVYSSNIFAILGLRALYIVVSKTVRRLEYLHYGLAVVLAFAAFKLITGEWFHVPALLSVAIIVVVIGTSVWASLLARRNVRRGPAHRE